MVKGSGLGVQFFGFRVGGFGFRISGSASRMQDESVPSVHSRVTRLYLFGV